MPPIDALTFDLDDTLWDNRPVMEHAEHGHYRWLDEALAAWHGAQAASLGRYAERFPLSAYQTRRQQLAERVPLRRGDFTWIREHALRELLEEYGLPRSAAAMWAAAGLAQFLDLRHRLTPYPEVAALLEALGGRYRLGAITNGNVDVTRLPIAAHFRVTIAAGEMLAPKPDARPFLAALARLGSRPSRALHVGDSWREDVLPAQRLGMRVAWIDARNEGATSLPPGVHRLRHVSELPDLLAGLD
ncbi:HAD family hydrolase [Franzmannia qiaohouensis]|uniref:HAD family hydrolase n=1 Tax=Franzmannia qiaohouensis TaxID=1329370 RepID=A0ABU1H8D9_9GAMM|nr:HAD family hydrolase [Halomonas qiaohouensis]MDR5903723.1 HAD family hydrolase [Halomonas qiaohouensis]